MYDSQHPTDPSLSGGDQFDLADIGLTFAKYVKLTDLGILKQEGLFNGDFDLDAVVAINSREGQPSSLSEDQNTTPVSFKLEQNYPNPFNPTTKINYELPITNYVDLSIYNSLGQKVATLVSERQSAGSYQVQWNASGFAAGLYYYRLHAGNFSDVKKLILLK
jgi:hypothetical protein